MRLSRVLGGPWSFRAMPTAGDAGATNHDEWMRAEVPGCVHTDLLANGKIADPFVGRNELNQQWISDSGWEYRTSFAADDSLLSRQRLEIVCKGLDTYATVRLNGTPILSADNMFCEWRADVRSLVRRGDNSLSVEFRSPISEVLPAYKRLGYVLPAVNDQATPMVSMFARKAPYHYGWDWGPRLVTSGIWRPVTLEAWDEARIDHVHVVQTELTEDRAALHVTAAMTAARACMARLTVAVSGEAAAGEAEIMLKAGPNSVSVGLAIAHPRRWWPNGLGKPDLYEVTTTLVIGGAAVDEDTTRIGLRTVEVLHEPDSGGKSFTICVNGAPVFMKGANYIPADSFPSRVSSERYRWLLQSAADCHMNMLRVWGGGIYEDDRFYDLCDELGILVWQDFMFACSMYPGDDAFVDSVRQEAIQVVRRLRNHPCLALWAGNNEIEAAWRRWGWQEKFGLSVEAQARIWSDYGRIFHELLPSIVAQHDPGRFYTRSSPSANDDAILPDTLGFGDMHYWGVWHAEKEYTAYAENVSRFMSEYGFQSFPELATVGYYASSTERDFDSPVMRAHQRHPRGNELIAAYMSREFRTPKDFVSFLYVSQVLQAIIIQYAAEAHRRRWPWCAGSLYWQLDDCWPVASWASIDYFGRWKALQYFARRFFAPLSVSTVEENGAVCVYLISDRREIADVFLVVRLVDFYGRELWRKARPVRLAATSSQLEFAGAIAEVLADGEPSRVVLVAEVFEDATHMKSLSRRLHYFTPAKDLALPDPEVELESLSSAVAGRHLLQVHAKNLARCLQLTADAAGVAFSDNYFDLLAGETRTVEWSGSPGVTFKATSIRDTY